MKKKIFLLSLVVLALAISAFAYMPTIQAQVTNLKVELNGRILDLTDDNGNELKPLIVDNTVYVPVKALGKNLDLEVKWNSLAEVVMLYDKDEAIYNNKANLYGVYPTTPQYSPIDGEYAPNKDDINIGDIQIVALNKVEEYVVIQNKGVLNVNLDGYTLVSEDGGQAYTFKDYEMIPNQIVKIGDRKLSKVDINWNSEKELWNNYHKDGIKLYSPKGELVSSLTSK